MIAQTPNTPYYAVIFTSLKQNDDDESYVYMAIRMEQLAKMQNGYLGIESARNEIGITVSYWQTLQDIKNWKENVEHKIAQEIGKEKWYSQYKIRICLVEREYGFER